MNKDTKEHRYDMLDAYFRKGTVGAEIGVFKGSFSQTILEYVKPKKIYCVDPWSVECFKDTYSKGYSQEELDKMHRIVCKRFKNNPEITVMRETSLQAAEKFEDNFFDWIYIDGDHSYEAVYNDILAWFPKVKEGGWICGDDYNVSRNDYKDEVILAVHAALNELGSSIRIARLFGNQYVLRKKGT